MASSARSKAWHPVLAVVLGLAILAALVAMNWLAFRALDDNYLLWYLANGALIGIIVSFLALIWEGLEAREELLAAHPLAYIAGCCTVLAALYHSMSVHLRNPMQGSRAMDDEVPIVLFDAFLSLFMLIAIFVATLGWVLVVAPLNYFLTLFTGAIARQELRGTVYRAIVLKEGNTFVLTTQRRSEELAQNAVDISLARKPFAITQGLTAAVLWASNYAYNNFF